MTFYEWFEHRFPAGTPEGSAARLGQFKDYLEEAWEAGYDQGADDYGYFPDAAPELVGDGSNYDL